MKLFVSLKLKNLVMFCLVLLTLVTSLNFAATKNFSYKNTNFLKFTLCNDSRQFLCGNLTVPMDYKNPELGKIKLPIRIHRATEKSHGYLIFNFGGPWADNFSILPSIMKKRFTESIIKYFDIVVINPRGTKPNLIQYHAKNQREFQKINEAIKEIFSLGNVSDAETLYELAKQKQFLSQYDKVYKYAGTTNTVQDIEELRKALNVDRLNFYMASYATRLGLAYLVEHPEHVQKIILDGNIAPSNQLASLLNGRALGALTIFNSFFENCYEAGNDCPLNNLIQSTQTKSAASLINNFNQFLEKTRQGKGIPTSEQYANKFVTARMIENLTFTEMQTSNWKNLAQAIYDAEINNVGDGLMKIYMTNTGFGPKSDSYSIDNNATRPSVICEDYLVPDFSKKAIWLNFINRINAKYSKIGSISTLWLTPMCIHWPTTSTPLLPKPSSQSLNKIVSPKVLIIGNTVDPMTPFRNALAVKNYLNKFNIQATIIEWNGVSHTALISDSLLSTCVFRNVDNFLLSSNISDYIECNDWENPFIRN